jgi:hypothetical protein
MEKSGLALAVEIANSSMNRPIFCLASAPVMSSNGSGSERRRSRMIANPGVTQNAKIMNFHSNASSTIELMIFVALWNVVPEHEFGSKVSQLKPSWLGGFHQGAHDQGVRDRNPCHDKNDPSCRCHLSSLRLGAS